MGINEAEALKLLTEQLAQTNAKLAAQAVMIRTLLSHVSERERISEELTSIVDDPRLPSAVRKHMISLLRAWPRDA